MSRSEREMTDGLWLCDRPGRGAGCGALVAGFPGRGAVRSRGMILLVVLLIVALLALLAATFAYRMRAELSAVTAQADQLQANLAAESGVNMAFLILRQYRTDFEKWYNNREAFRRVIVWSPGKIGGEMSLNQEVEGGQPAWRFSVLAPVTDSTFGGEESEFRYGLQDEAGKLNLNTATRAQLITFFDQLKLENVRPEQLADAIIDWRDSDSDPGEFGAEQEYYQSLNPPYRVKNGPIETVEEVLLIRGFNGRILYGEDYNRNGHLDANEDDGEEGQFPPDNGDGELDRGIYPFVTVYSRDMNSANDNRQRLNINASIDLEKIPDEIRQILEQEIRPEVFQFIRDAQAKGYRFRSAAELWGLRIGKKKQLQGSAGRGQQDRGGSRGPGRRPGDERGDELEAGEQPPPEPDMIGPEGAPDGAIDRRGEDVLPPRGPGGRRGPEGGRQGPWREGTPGIRDRGGTPPAGRGPGPRTSDEFEDPMEGADKNIRRRMQEMRGDQRVPTIEDLRAGRPDLDDSVFAPPGGQQPAGAGPAEGGREQGRPPGDRGGGQRGQPGTGRPGEDARAGAGAGGRGPRGGGAQAGAEAVEDGREDEYEEIIESPVQPDDMPAILDRLTADQNPIQFGLINVNTASRNVLLTLPGLEEQDVDAILAARAGLDDTARKTPAWLCGVLSPAQMRAIGPFITARSLQFTIESIGFADHVGTYKRLQVVVEMRGQVEQVLYWRDISPLGVGYPLREDEWKHEVRLRNR